MNIGFFTDSYFPQINGVTFTLQAWRGELERRGHKVFIYYPGGDYTPGEREYPFPAVNFKYYPGYRIATPLGVPKDTKQLDIIHQHGLYGMAFAGLRASWAHKTPKMLTFHTPGDEYLRYIPGNRMFGGIYRGIYMAWERWLLDRKSVV
jgi:1,2-diacylglycerol 3-alpha-glucosyltransferase